MNNCGRCNGKGTIQEKDGKDLVIRKCHICNGTGKQQSKEWERG